MLSDIEGHSSSPAIEATILQLRNCRIEAQVGVFAEDFNPWCTLLREGIRSREQKNAQQSCIPDFHLFFLISVFVLTILM
jgi:hypothetical protein